MNNNYNDEKDKPVVIAFDSSSGSGPYFCSIDGFKLVLFDREIGEWICTRCHACYFTGRELVKKADKLELPDLKTDDALVAYPPDFNYNDSPAATKYYKKENQPLPPFFEQLKKRGFKITSYTEERSY